MATPGCYVTAASLALAPLVQQGLIDPRVVVDAFRRDRAGRALKHSSLFATVDEDFYVHGLLDHRHTPEIEQVTGAQVLFTPHLAPMSADPRHLLRPPGSVRHHGEPPGGAGPLL